jgi:ornithine cyclodeaminase
MSEVLLLNKEELERCVPLDAAAVGCIENAFLTLATEDVIMPPIMQLVMEHNNAEVCVKTAFMPSLDSFAIKISPGFFNNPALGLPSGSGIINLFNSITGVLEAVLLDRGYLTNVRTAAAGAVAANWLSRKNSRKAAVIGAGIQADLQLRALMLVREIAEVSIWARDGDKAALFAKNFEEETEIVTNTANSVHDACAGVDVVITTTPSEQPLVHWNDLEPGQHVTAMGSDSERKRELAADIMLKADRYIPDSLSQVRLMGELHHSIDENIISSTQPFDELGQVIAGLAPGRTSDNQITVCDLTGTGAQDTAIATLALQLALSLNLGTVV